MKTNPLQETDFADFQCPYCENTVSFPKAEAGALKQCPTCLESIIVPKPGETSAEKIPFPLQTPRLIIRRLRPLDWQDLSALMSNGESLRYLPWTPLSGEEAEEWLANEKQGAFPHHDKSVYFGLEALEDGRMIGLVCFWFPDGGFDLAQFLIQINPKWQRQGFATEGVQGLFSYAFNGLRAHRIVAYCDTRNLPARALLLKSGMRLEGEFLKDQLVKEEWVNSLGFALLKEEFEGWSKA